MQHGSPVFAGQRFGVGVVASKAVDQSWAIFQPVVKKFGLAFRSRDTEK